MQKTYRGAGEPDLFLFKESGLFMFVEVKKGADRVGPAQLECIAQIRAILRCPVEIVYATDREGYVPKRIDSISSGARASESFNNDHSARALQAPPEAGRTEVVQREPASPPASSSGNVADQGRKADLLARFGKDPIFQVQGKLGRVDVGSSPAPTEGRSLPATSTTLGCELRIGVGA
ncbi:MAG: VRR-NUC domain-containing protein [Comamonadaceae bacterium]|nr:VRR-NUC domain-containing protein [Comamonadaceae bacterium]